MPDHFCKKAILTCKESLHTFVTQFRWAMAGLIQLMWQVMLQKVSSTALHFLIGVNMTAEKLTKIRDALAIAAAHHVGPYNKSIAEALEDVERELHTVSMFQSKGYHQYVSWVQK